MESVLNQSIMMLHFSYRVCSLWTERLESFMRLSALCQCCHTEVAFYKSYNIKTE